MRQKMKHSTHYVLSTGSGWAVFEEGKHKPESVHESMYEAAQHAEERANRFHTDCIIYGMDGDIRFSNI
ncbi:DUF2188 domain-containing protein [Candidatus Woesearchaeota archaeon]|nr:DUF2188 domain-containing protein [Candidatus Woesearchaeota archaeon]